MQQIGAPDADRTLGPAGHRKVGRNSPPIHGQIKKGEVRNPNGRPKGSKNTKTLITEAFDQKVSVKGVAKKISLRHLAIIKLVRKAAEGDIKAFQSLLQLEGYSPTAVSAEAEVLSDNEQLTEKDKAVIHFLNEQMRKDIQESMQQKLSIKKRKGQM